MIAVINSPVSNTFSFTSALEKLGLEYQIVNNPQEINEGHKYLVLPGVGHATVMMDYLKQRGWDEFIKSGRLPFLGICLGFQILFETLEESGEQGLGVFQGKVQRLPFAPNPHMGWSREVNGDDYYYYVHSYGVLESPQAKTFILTPLPVVSRAQFGSFTGVQFHPERSGRVGEAFLKGYFK